SLLTGALLQAGIKRIAARERPDGIACTGQEPLPNCDSNNRYRSFVSGHATMTFTAAGLTCAHHAQVPIYGAPWADVGACVVSMAAALTTSLLRMIGDRHYFSDVLAGALVGLGAGLLMPELLRFR